ncbi:MAG: type VI secretion system accessory protein TagJ [Chromatiaceae bacterium]|jgi:type VI secretion system protein ImpE
MSAEQLLMEGDLDAALRELQAQVRREPANAKYRIFLFQLLAVLGQWDRALSQLNVAGELDEGVLAMVQTYREALRCEVLRGDVFAGRRSPMVLGEPDNWLALLLEALRLAAEERYEESGQVRAQALEGAPMTPGSIDGVPFDWIADGDMRMGPVLEAIVNGRYYWVPFSHVARLTIEKPTDLRDLVWMPAYFTWANGGEGVGLIPTRYPDSQASQDTDLRRARKTLWMERPGGLFVGLGQRMLATDEGEYAIMSVREITLRPGEGESGVSGGTHGS